MTKIVQLGISCFIDEFSVLPVVQLPSFKPSSRKHHPSVCRQVSGLQSGEHFREHFVPKYPSVQAVVQLRPVHPSAHVQNPSVGRHVALIQLGEHTCEQFVPKRPSSQDMLQLFPMYPFRQPL